MKFELERKLPTCPDTLSCVVCRQCFDARRIRTLLRSDRGLVIGDICPACSKLEAKAIKQTLREQANQLMSQPKGKGAQTLSFHKQALELLEVSTETVKFPTFYQRLLKQIEIFAQESQELESARFNLSNSAAKQRSRLERLLRQHDDSQF
jgi:hypothetical protein